MKTMQWSPQYHNDNSGIGLVTYWGVEGTFRAVTAEEYKEFKEYQRGSGTKYATRHDGEIVSCCPEIFAEHIDMIAGNGGWQLRYEMKQVVLGKTRFMVLSSQGAMRRLMEEGNPNPYGIVFVIGSISKDSDTPSTPTTTAATITKVEIDGEIVEADSKSFALESQLQEFLLTNWEKTELAKEYKIYASQDIFGTGRLDILAQSHCGKKWLVIELKKGRASDKVLGQTQRYMGEVLTNYAGEGDEVRGMIIALEDDEKLRMALRVAPNITFKRYRMTFELF